VVEQLDVDLGTLVMWNKKLSANKKKNTRIDIDNTALSQQMYMRFSFVNIQNRSGCMEAVVWKRLCV
jgi:hypothetical protein